MLLMKKQFLVFLHCVSIIWALRFPVLQYSTVRKFERRRYISISESNRNFQDSNKGSQELGIFSNSTTIAAIIDAPNLNEIPKSINGLNEQPSFSAPPRKAMIVNSSAIASNISSTNSFINMHNKEKQGLKTIRNAGSILVKGLLDNWLILGEIFVIAMAKHNPSFGATGGPLRPEFTISKCGVFFIFFINGVALQLTGTSSADMQTAVKTNILIQAFNFGLIPLLALLLAPLYPDPVFRDGLLVLSCLPCTINICVAQTLAAGGNMGTAIFNAIAANVVGVFLTPLLAILTLGAGKGVSLASTLSKLGGVVILPLTLGQLVRQTPLGEFFQSINKYSRTISSWLLLAIVYNVFSDTFMQGIGVGGAALVRLMFLMPLAYLALSLLFWKMANKLLPGIDPPTRAAALLCSSQKTLAFGIPFIKMALGTRSDIAYILAPLLMYAPSQLLLGSALLVPALRHWIRDSQSYKSGSGI